MISCASGAGTLHTAIARALQSVIDRALDPDADAGEVLSYFAGTVEALELVAKELGSGRI